MASNILTSPSLVCFFILIIMFLLFSPLASRPVQTYVFAPPPPPHPVVYAPPTARAVVYVPPASPEHPYTTILRQSQWCHNNRLNWSHSYKYKALAWYYGFCHLLNKYPVKISRYQLLVFGYMSQISVCFISN